MVLSPHPSAPVVLIVDEGISFGGSAVVAAVLAETMPQDRFHLILAVAMEPALLASRTPDGIRLVQVAKPFSYLDAARWNARSDRLAPPLRRLARSAGTLWRLIRNGQYVQQLVRIIRNERVALVHLNNSTANLEGLIAARLAGTPWMVHAHGFVGNNRLNRRLATRARQWVAVSSTVGDSIVAAGVPRQQITVLPNPLTVTPEPLSETERRAARTEFGIPPEVPTFGIVGRIVPWKGQKEFLEAARLVGNRIPNAVAVVVGDATDGSEEYAEALRATVANGWRTKVVFAGFQADPRRAYALLDLVVHSSIEPEPFGLVITEAMGYGLPVIASPFGAPVEIIRDGIDGFLCDPQTPEVVAQRIIDLLSYEELRSRIGETGRQSVLTKLSPAAYAAAMAEVYTKALPEPPATAAHELRA